MLQHKRQAKIVDDALVDGDLITLNFTNSKESENASSGQ